MKWGVEGSAVVCCNNVEIVCLNVVFDAGGARAIGSVGARGVASLLELFEWYVVGGSAVIAIKVKVARCLNHVDMQE